MFIIMDQDRFINYAKFASLEDAINEAMSCGDPLSYIVEVRGSVVKRYEEYRRGLTGEINE